MRKKKAAEAAELALPRRVEGYNPLSHLVKKDDEGKERWYLPLEHKRLWLSLWAEQNGVSVCSTTEVVPEANLIPGIGMLKATVTLSIQDEPERVATAYVAIQNDQVVDYYSNLPQIAVARALSQVLTAAGFFVPTVGGDEETETPNTPASVVSSVVTTPVPVPDAPEILEDAPWLRSGSGEKVAVPKVEPPKVEPVPFQMSLEEARNYLVRKEELTGQAAMMADRIRKVCGAKATVATVLNVPAGTDLKQSGKVVLQWLAGRHHRPDGTPVGTVLEPGSKLCRAICAVLDAEEADSTDSK